MRFLFSQRKADSPLKHDEFHEVVGMADVADCQHDMNLMDCEKVEARGVEPLSETPSAMVSTRLAGGLVIRTGLARLRRCLS